MNRFNTLLLYVLLFSVAYVVFPASAQEKTGWYTGGALGLSNYRVTEYDDDVNLSDEFVDFEETVFSYRAYLGRRVNQHFSLELALTDYGEAEGPLSEGLSNNNEFEIHERGATMFLTGFLPLGNHYLPELKHVELFGQVGPAWVNQEVKLNATNSSGTHVQSSREENGIGAGVGVGLNLYVTERLAIRGELESIFGDPTALDDEMDTERIHGFVGVQYNFHDLPVSETGR